jgi:hypothetical protein
VNNSIIAVEGAPSADENAWSSREAPLMVVLAVGGAILLFAAYRLVRAARRRDTRHRH